MTAREIPAEIVDLIAPLVHDGCVWTEKECRGDHPLACWQMTRERLAAAWPLIAAQASAPLLALIRDLSDPEECWFDHHGGCQAHGYLSLEPGEMCPHAEAKQVLARTTAHTDPEEHRP